MPRVERVLSLPRRQQERFFNPHIGIPEDLDRIYRRNQLRIGWPKGALRVFEAMAREHTVALVGIALGDEGKGRLVDNKIEALLRIPEVTRVDVIRFQGGNNSGHTIERNSIRLALHQVPSGVMYEETVGWIDRGMIINPEDLQTEVEYVEKHVGDLRGKLFVSEQAILNTDVDRAEEVLNRELSEGRANGGTGRGIGPSSAHHLDKKGLKISDLMDDNWREKLSIQYDQKEKEFAAHERVFSQTYVPDYKKTVETNKEEKRQVGSKAEFLDRLETARSWIHQRHMVTNMYLMHRELFQDMSRGVIFEGAQAVGLHPWLGTAPDVTSTNTTVYGISEGTGLWKQQDIKQIIGIFKVPYTSSVGSRRMPTHVDLPKNLKDPKDLPEDSTLEQKWAAWVRKEAREWGTTTGRPRDITHLDLALITYNAYMSGIEMLAGTHLDIAREGETIKICTHYTDEKGNFVPYQPGLRYQQKAIPNYVQLPGWDGEACKKARTLDEIPLNARKFLAFVQARTEFPIAAITTGPSRENLIELPGYS